MRSKTTAQRLYTLFKHIAEGIELDNPRNKLKADVYLDDMCEVARAIGGRGCEKEFLQLMNENWCSKYVDE